jgi:hypothetical protein
MSTSSAVTESGAPQVGHAESEQREFDSLRRVSVSAISFIAAASYEPLRLMSR